MKRVNDVNPPTSFDKIWDKLLRVDDEQTGTEQSRSSRTIKQEARKRINIIKGQLEGLLKMIDEEGYCMDLLNQSLAIQNSIKSVDSLLLEKHLKTHVADQFQSQKDKAVEELLRLFKRVHQ